MDGERTHVVNQVAKAAYPRVALVGARIPAGGGQRKRYVKSSPADLQKKLLSVASGTDTW